MIVLREIGSVALIKRHSSFIGPDKARRQLVVEDILNRQTMRRSLAAEDCIATGKTRRAGHCKMQDFLFTEEILAETQWRRTLAYLGRNLMLMESQELRRKVVKFVNSVITKVTQQLYTVPAPNP